MLFKLNFILTLHSKNYKKDSSHMEQPSWDDPTLMNQDVFTRLTKKYHKSNAQIILRWHVQKGFITITGATIPEFITANIDIFDFSLTDKEMAEIAKLDNTKRFVDLNDDEYEKLAASITSFDQE